MVFRNAGKAETSLHTCGNFRAHVDISPLFQPVTATVLSSYLPDETVRVSVRCRDQRRALPPKVYCSNAILLTNRLFLARIPPAKVLPSAATYLLLLDLECITCMRIYTREVWRLLDGVQQHSTQYGDNAPRHIHGESAHVDRRRGRLQPCHSFRSIPFLLSVQLIVSLYGRCLCCTNALKCHPEMYKSACRPQTDPRPQHRP